MFSSSTRRESYVFRVLQMNVNTFLTMREVAAWELSLASPEDHSRYWLRRTQQEPIV